MKITIPKIPIPQGTGEMSDVRKKTLLWLQKYRLWSFAKYIVLVTILISYAFIGAAIFYSIEKPAQDARLEAAANESKFRRQLVVDALVNLATTCLNSSHSTAVYCRNATMNLIEAYERDNAEDGEKMWDFWNAFYYAGTIYTTIGFGNVYCYTRLGQGLTILYALIGIPFMLTALKYIGQALFAKTSLGWGYFRRWVRRLYRQYREDSAKRKKLSFVERRESALPTYDSEDGMEEVFPVPLAIGIICVYMLVVAGLIKWHNPSWDYFISLYYFFISLSTIGLGDKIALPDNHNYLLSFIYTVIGLALLSMCINVMQNRVERTYSRALQNMEALLQLSEQFYEDDEDGIASPTIEHPDWALFRASQVLSTLNIKRVGSIAYPYLHQNSAMSKADLRRNSRMILDHLYNKNPHHFRQSIAMIHRIRSSQRSDDRNSTGQRNSVQHDSVFSKGEEGKPHRLTSVRFSDSVKENNKIDEDVEVYATGESGKY